MAKVHFITGKGGVGKSCIAASLCSKLSKRGEGPVLLIDVQGIGHSLKLLGLKHVPFANTGLPETDNAYGSRILPRETFKQYFSHLLALGNENSAVAQLTSALREKITDLLLENKVVSAFVDACPGLEPAVLLGKIHFEATEGCAPESDVPWAHIVVDAPSTGHFVMLFKSTFALIDVFSAGTVLKQAKSIREFALDKNSTKIHIVSTAEELPLREAMEMSSKINELGLTVTQYILNRAPPMESSDLASSKNLPPSSPWTREILLQKEIWDDQNMLLSEFIKSLPDGTRISRVNERADLNSARGIEAIEPQIDECLT